MAYRSVVRALVAYCPFVPLPLAEVWVRNRWRQLNESRSWSFLRRVGYWSIPESVSSGTVAVLEGGTEVVGTGTAFTSSMVGRQLKVNFSAPVYQIGEVLSETSLVITQPWAGASVSGSTYMLLQCYVDAPEDLLTFLSVVSLHNMWRLIIHRHSSVDIDLWDPRRQATGTPYLAANLTYSTPAAGAVAVPRFELWPHPTSKAVYPYVYVRRCDDIDDDTVLPRILTDDILLAGGLADLCLWPGLEDRKNPLFMPDLAAKYERDWLMKLALAGKQDNEIYQEDLKYDNYPIVPWNASWMQAHGTMEV